MPGLFDPFTLRGVTLRNRVGVPPMCQYSADDDGLANDWHLVHLGARAAGGAGLVVAEATAVEARGRISPADLGIWSDRHVDALARVAAFVAGQGATPGIQLAHAGRKAATARPWEGGRPLSSAGGGWPVIGPSALAFAPGYAVPTEMTSEDIAAVTTAFRDGAVRAAAAGFRLLEIHAAHGYLLHSFLSPVSNRRTDGFGGSFEGRTRFLLDVVGAVRGAIPEELPLAVRLSCVDWIEGGWGLEETVALARRLATAGVDLIDCSSGGSSPDARPAVGPGYQVPFAEVVRRESGVATAAVGLITESRQAAEVIAREQADVALVGRGTLRDAAWALHAAVELGCPPPVPPQYLRAY